MTTLHSYFSYVDAPAALAWLERAFGFETTMRWEDEEGTLAHAELRLDQAAIMVFADAGQGYDRMHPKLRVRLLGVRLLGVRLVRGCRSRVCWLHGP